MPIHHITRHVGMGLHTMFFILFVNHSFHTLLATVDWLLFGMFCMSLLWIFHDSTWEWAPTPW